MAVAAGYLSGATGSQLASPQAHLLAAVWSPSPPEAMVRWLKCHTHHGISGRGGGRPVGRLRQG